MKRLPQPVPPDSVRALKPPGNSEIGKQVVFQIVY